MTVTDVHPGSSLAQSLEWVLTPEFLLRVAGLPIDIVDDLDFTATVGLTNEILAMESSLAQSRPELLDALESASAPYLSQPEIRNPLLSFKRDAFNLRRPRKPAAIRDLIARVAPATQPIVEAWLSRWQDLAALAMRRSAAFDQDLRHSRAKLQALSGNPDLRAGILLASPELDRALDRYATAGSSLDKRQRRAERSFVEYLLRTACKTSPFSTLTSVAVGTIVDGGGPEPVAYALSDVTKRGFARFNIAHLANLSALVLADRTIRHRLQVRVAAGWHTEGGRVRYLRRRQQLGEETDTAAVLVGQVHEELFYLPSGPVLTTILQVLDGGRAMTVADLIAEIATRRAHADDPVEVERYVTRLMGLGMLVVPDLSVDLRASDPVAGYRSRLESLALPATDQLAKRLATIESLVKAYPTQPIAQRRQSLDAIRDELRQAKVDLGDPAAAASRTVVYEDAVITPDRLSINRQAWQHVIDDLTSIAEIMPIFDMNTPRRLSVKGFFRERYGRGNTVRDFLAFAHRFHQDFYGQYRQQEMAAWRDDTLGSSGARRDNYFQQPELTRLAAGRGHALDYARDAAARLASGATELVLDQDFCTSLAEFVPSGLDDVRATAFLAQLFRSGGEPRLVINRIYHGLTLLFSRFAHCFPEESGHRLVPGLRAAIARVQPPGAVFAELGGGYDITNLNLHPAIVPYQLVCPDEVSRRPQHEQIPIDDLYLVDDLVADRLVLRSHRLDRVVIPVYLGFLLPLALPELQQVLLAFAPGTMGGIDLSSAISGRTRDGVEFMPRVRYRSLVLQRASWRSPAGSLPVREPGEGDADWFLKVARWRRHHELPRRAFASIARGGAETTAEDGRASAGERKPLYVDFDNWVTVAALENLVASAPAGVTFTEMMPDRDDLWFQHDGHPYVTEFIVELNATLRRSA